MVEASGDAICRLAAGGTLEVLTELIAEAALALLADPIGKPDPPSSPRRDPAPQRIPVVLAVPRATPDEHVPLPCNGYASRESRIPRSRLARRAPIDEKSVTGLRKPLFEHWSGRGRADRARGPRRPPHATGGPSGRRERAGRTRRGLGVASPPTTPPIRSRSVDVPVTTTCAPSAATTSPTVAKLPGGYRRRPSPAPGCSGRAAWRPGCGGR